jgi:VCBS repeat-containing protein
VVQDYFSYELKDTGGLTDLAQLTVFVRGRNNPPVTAPLVIESGLEAGGVANGTAGFDPSGDVTTSNIDLEGDPLTITAIRTSDVNGNGTAGTIGMPLAGNYGWLTQQADGTFTYEIDNNNLAVEALRSSGDTLRELFIYTVSDIYGASAESSILIVINAANDNPVAVADTGTAVEAGGAANTTPGSNATGNVLTNDTDVDAYGETRAVMSVSGVAAGTVNGTTTGNFGSLTLNADGSYTYTVDNTNPAVEALRLASQTLTDTFTYEVIDAASATATATLTITIQGANDNPVASDDIGAATDAAGPPVTTGNVLPNDSDIDGGDSKTVVAVRTGAETGAGSAGSIGAKLQGKYGTLVLNADGSWRYEVDTTNQDVLNAAGAGKVLSDVFTYTMSDTAGATDQAQLTITLDMVAPYTETGMLSFFSRETESGGRSIPLPNVEPITFIHQVVSAIDRQMRISNTRNDGTDITQEAPLEIRSISLGAGLGLDPDQFVGRAVQQSRLVSKLDSLQVEARQGVVSLSADGLLADPSVFVPDSRLMIEAAPTPRDRLVLRTSSAPSFREQLELAAQRFRPVTVNSHPARIPGEIHHIS